MNYRPRYLKGSRPQRGTALLLVLILLTVLLLGAVSFAKMSDSFSSLSGNTAFSQAARQAATLGFSAASEQLKELTTETTPSSWYFPTEKPVDAAGLPREIDWTQAPSISSGMYEVRYVVERLCSEAISVSAPLANAKCALIEVPELDSARTDFETMTSTPSRQYRVTIRVTGPKKTISWTQGLIVKS